MSGQVIGTGRGCLYSLGSILICGAMLPGGMWLFTGWGLLPWRLDLIFGLSVVVTVGLFISWSLGWVHNRSVLWSRPVWIVHPATRAILVFAFFTFLASWPFGASANPLIEFFGILFAPVVGTLIALFWVFVFGLRQSQRGL